MTKKPANNRKSWSTGDDWILRQYAELGYTKEQAAKKLGRTVAAVQERMGKLKLLNGKPKGYYKRKTESFEIAPAYIHTAKKEFGKVNPMALAREKMQDRFRTINGVEYYQGRIIHGMRDWHNIIRDLNKILKESGQQQVDQNPEWVV